MGVNGIDETNDSDEILEQKQEGEENKGLEEEKESGLYPTEKLEERYSVYTDKFKTELYTFGVKNGFSHEDLEFVIDFIKENDIKCATWSIGKANYFGISLNDDRIKFKFDPEEDGVIEIKDNESLDSEEKIRFTQIVAEIFSHGKTNFGEGMGTIYRLSRMNNFQNEIDENKQDFPDEYWINQGIMTPKVKAIYYKLREICEKFNNDIELRRPEDWPIKREIKTEGKISVHFSSNGCPMEMNTPYGTYKPLPISPIDSDEEKNFIEELGKHFNLEEKGREKTIDGESEFVTGYLIEVDY